MRKSRSLLTTSILAASMMFVVSSAPAQTPSMPSRYTVEGQVTKVDAKRGWVDVKTSEGSMKLHFPPPALDGVKKGDSLTVELGLTTGGPAARSMEKK